MYLSIVIGSLQQSSETLATKELTRHKISTLHGYYDRKKWLFFI